MKLYFVRHGESEANVIRVISNRGWIHPLTEKGREQAHQLAEELREIQAARIYTSPLRRAVETAEILAQAMGLACEVTGALREYDCGLLEGKSDAGSWEQHRRLREDWLLRQQWDRRIESGESFYDIESRFRPFIEGLAAGGVGRDENVILVGHGGTYACMLPRICANIDFEDVAGIPFRNTAYVLVEVTQSGLHCLEWCGMVF